VFVECFGPRTYTLPLPAVADAILNGSLPRLRHLQINAARTVASVNLDPILDDDRVMRNVASLGLQGEYRRLVPTRFSRRLDSLTDLQMLEVEAANGSVRVPGNLRQLALRRFDDEGVMCTLKYIRHAPAPHLALTALDITGSTVPDVELLAGAVRKLPTLKLLRLKDIWYHLESAEAGTAVVAACKSLLQLHTLDLSSNRFTDPACFTCAGRFASLTHLDLSRNEFTCTDLRQLLVQSGGYPALQTVCS
jgi:hypothetical protein